MRFLILFWLLVHAAIGHAAAPAANRLPRQVLINGVEFVLVPEGWFWYSVENGFSDLNFRLGTPLYRDVRIWLDSYYIAKYEARARDLQVFFNSGQARFLGQYRGKEDGCTVRADAEGKYFLVEPERELPATGLSWDLADEFARWMGFRLPTEAEWEKAARGTDRRHWPWGNQYPDDTYANFWRQLGCHPAAVDAFPKGVSPYGAYNMASNVWEAVADWINADFDKRLKSGTRNPPLANGGTRVTSNSSPVKIYKGGGWVSSSGDMTAHRRTGDQPEVDFYTYGTRFALDASRVRERLANGTASVLLP